jgi:Na+/H+ antiporter NhaA
VGELAGRAELHRCAKNLNLSFGLGRYLPEHDLHFWVNDGLMTVFFLVVGLEIRREMHDGSLSDPRAAILPLAAAAGGVAVPALLYLLINTDPVTQRLGHPDRDGYRFRRGRLSLKRQGCRRRCGCCC